MSMRINLISDRTNRSPRKREKKIHISFLHVVQSLKCRFFSVVSFSAAHIISQRAQSCVIRCLFPDNVNLPDKDGTSNGHGDSDDREIDSCELDAANANMLSPQNITPQQTCKRSAKRSAKGAVVNTNGHAVYRSPESAIADRNAVLSMNLLPRLNDSGEENGCANVCSSELMVSKKWLAQNSSMRDIQDSSNAYVAKNHGQEAHSANCSYRSSPVDPVIPSIRKHRHPSLGDECLH